jgi:hypothetical protein
MWASLSPGISMLSVLERTRRLERAAVSTLICNCKAPPPPIECNLVVEVREDNVVCWRRLAAPSRAGQSRRSSQIL